jgi:hypothetical protein
MKPKAKSFMPAFFPNVFLRMLLFSVFLLFITPFCLEAQVTIGTLSAPENGALLELKEWDATFSTPDVANSKRGLLFPKVSLSSGKSLFPLYATTEEPEASAAKGMIVYNVNSKATGVNVGLCVWNGKEWSSIAGGGLSSTAIFDVNCSRPITVNGNLAKGEMLTPALNTIILPVTVSREGKYHILACSEPDNHYYFEAAGEFPKTGNFNLALSGIGTPQYSTPERNETKDSVKLYLNGEAYDVASKCPSTALPGLKVNDLPVNYFFSCAQVNLSDAGLKVNRPSTGAFISIRLQVPKASVGAKYRIETNTNSGIKFEGEGTLQSEQQTVTLKANGATPATVGAIRFEFTTNSSDPRLDACPVEVLVSGRSIRVAAWGKDDSGEWDIGSSKKGVANLLQCAELFGLGLNGNPVCPVEEIFFSRTASFPASLKQTDVVIMSYDASAAASENERKALIDFVNNKGVLIQCMEDQNPMDIPDSIFGKNRIRKDGRKTGSECAATLIPGNRIVNGDYADLSGKKIGYDGGYNLAFSIADSTDIEVVATRDCDNIATALKHKTKPYILLGDGGIFCGENTPASSSEYSPLLVNKRKLPEIKSNHHPNGNTAVYNAHLFANIMLWAIQYRLSLNL